MRIPQIEIQEVRSAIAETVSIIPNKKTFDIILKSIDLMMDDIVQAREEIVSEKVKNELIVWDHIFEKFGEREAYYATQFDIENNIYKPLLLGEYPENLEELEAPDYPDVETPWRLINDLSLIAAKAGKKTKYFEELKNRWMNNFISFWKSSAINFKKQAHEIVLPGSPPEEEEEEPEEEASLYDKAAAKAEEFMNSASDFFTGKTLEAAKKKAKDIGTGLMVGLVLGVLVTALIISRKRR
jgi:hypothetical protein